MEMMLLVPALLLVGIAVGWIARGHVHEVVDKAVAAVKDAADKAASV